MSDTEYTLIPTSPEVWAVIRARHLEMVVFASFSDPAGERCPGRAEMWTRYGFPGADFATLEARSTWTIPTDEPRYRRIDEKHEYWLLVPKENSDE